MSMDDFNKIKKKLVELENGFPEIEGNHFHSDGKVYVDSLVNDYRDSLARLISRMEEVEKFRNFLFDPDFKTKMSSFTGYVRRKSGYMYRHPFHEYADSSWVDVAKKFGIDINSCGLTRAKLGKLYEAECDRQNLIASKRRKARELNSSDKIRFTELARYKVDSDRKDKMVSNIWDRLHYYKRAKRTGTFRPIMYSRMISLMSESLYRRCRSDRGRYSSDSYYRNYQTQYSPEWKDLKEINEVFTHEGIIFIKCEDKAKRYYSDGVYEYDNDLLHVSPKGVTTQKFKGWLALAPNFKGSSPFGTFFQPHEHTHNLNSNPTFRVVASREMGRLSMKSLHQFVEEVTSKKDKLIKRDLYKEVEEIFELVRSDYDAPPRDFEIMTNHIKECLFLDRRIQKFDSPQEFSKKLTTQAEVVVYNVEEPSDEAALQAVLQVYQILCDAIRPILDA